MENKHQFIIVVAGFQASGKTTMAKMIEENYNISRIAGDDIRKFIWSTIKYYEGMDHSHKNPLINSANITVENTRKSLFDELMNQEQSVIIDGAGFSVEQRQRWLSKEVKDKYGVKTILIYVKADEEALVKRYKERDKTKGKWKDTYFKTRKDAFEEPKPEEADYFFTATNGQEDLVLKELDSILKP
ncbi:MAG: nucleoside monophosphate kinase [archaeon]